MQQGPSHAHLCKRETLVMVAIPVPAPTVATMTFLELPGSRYRLRKALVAEIETDPAGFVVSEQHTGVYYYDQDLSKSIAGFFKAFVDQFEFLQSNASNLSPCLQAELEQFQSLVELETA